MRPLRGAANLRLSRKSLYLKIQCEVLTPFPDFFFPPHSGAVFNAASCLFLNPVFSTGVPLHACVESLVPSTLAAHSPRSSIHGVAHIGPAKMAHFLAVINKKTMSSLFQPTRDPVFKRAAASTPH